MKLLTISGSLRAGASNTALLDAVALVAPSNMTVRRYPSVAALPHFNPDDDVAERLPDAVSQFRALVGESDAILLSTPEYAHGLPGSFKNALDWLVGSIEFPGKLVATVSLRARSTHAPAQLREILTTMSARLMEPPQVVIELPRRDLDAASIGADQVLSAALRRVLDDIERAARA
jgi:NAD(P)H-dependent FMN reductase